MINKQGYKAALKVFNNSRTEVIDTYRKFKANKQNALHIPPKVYTACVKGFKDKIEKIDLDILKFKEENNPNRVVTVSVTELLIIQSMIEDVYIQTHDEMPALILHQASYKIRQIIEGA